MQWHKKLSKQCLILSQKNKISQGNLTLKIFSHSNLSHHPFSKREKAASLLRFQIVISLCVFQLHVWGAHRQGHDGKNATNIWELWDELVWNTDVQEKQWVATLHARKEKTSTVSSSCKCIQSLCNIQQSSKAAKNISTSRNVLIGWEPDQRSLPQQNVGLFVSCCWCNMQSFERPSRFLLCYMHTLILALYKKQVMKLNVCCSLYFQGRLFGFLWRLLPFVMNKKKWSCFSAHSATSQPLNSLLKTILPKVRLWANLICLTSHFYQTGWEEVKWGKKECTSILGRHMSL